MAKKYFVYRNLHTKTFSLRHGKKVIAHPTMFFMSLVDLKVNEAGRQRVLKTGHKNVHAFAAGQSYHELQEKPDTTTYTEITYNPRKKGSFVIKRTGKPVKYAGDVIGFDNRLFGRGLK